MEKIPRLVIPAINTLIIALIVEKIHGKILREHKAAGKPFYPAWNAAAIGLFCAAVFVGAAVG